MKTIIFCTSPKFLWFFRSLNVYLRNSYIKQITNTFNIFEVQDDIFNASEVRFCDHKASLIEDKLILKIFKNKSSFIKNWGGNVYSKFFFSKPVLKEAQTIFESFDFAQKVCSKFSISEKVYIFPPSFSLKVYKAMKEISVIPKFIKIHPLAYVYICLFNLLKNLYFFIRMILYPEILFLKCKKKLPSQLNKKYHSCVYLDDGLLGVNSKDELITNKNIFKLFDETNTLYIDDRYQKSQKWPLIIKKTSQHVLRLEDLTEFFDKKKYLEFIFNEAFFWRWKMIKLCFKYPFLFPTCSRSLRLKILWEMFYCNFSINNAFRLMTEENNTSYIVHKKNNTSTFFVYFSTTNSITKRVNVNKSMAHEYTHMIIDNVISSKISNNWIKSLENKVGKYIDLGPIFSDIVFKQISRKHKVLSKLNINKRMKVVSFFDHTTGYKGVMSSKSYYLFISAMIKLAIKNPAIHFVYRSKKNLNVLNSQLNFNIFHIIDSINEITNCTYSNEYDVDSFEVMGASDLVVSAPKSSVIYEALCGGVKAISFDPLNHYGDFNDESNNFINHNAYTFEDLKKLVNFWLYESSKEEFNVFLNSHIKTNIDEKCLDHKMIDSFKKLF